MHNLDHKNLGIINDYDLTVKEEVRDELTINMELKPIVNESVKEPIHFLAIEEEVPIKEVKKFNSCSFDNSSKGEKEARGNHTPENNLGLERIRYKMACNVDVASVENKETSLELIE
ncbi:hypothetical protein J1N35_005636 [Gossypium stocksii]|uniref:Uncharacterized protein n=1 Tax=Gossypium stocksii TaxID=47602 RepID=A0A9D3WFC0_9ROSI|nr:hypothetical protein J1N35_005636 [Gossypium stocksii]